MHGRKKLESKAKIFSCVLTYAVDDRKKKDTSTIIHLWRKIRSNFIQAPGFRSQCSARVPRLVDAGGVRQRYAGGDDNRLREGWRLLSCLQIYLQIKTKKLVC
jgi:hypothetical protein